MKKFNCGFKMQDLLKPSLVCMFFMTKKKGVIYIGESDNLQKEFAKYVDTNFENDACKQKTHTYQRTFVENPKERKIQLLEDYKTKHGKMPCCNADID